MESDPMAEFLIDDAGAASDGELQYAIENFCGMPPPSTRVDIGEPYMDGCCGFDPANSRKRASNESCSRPKSKACREKIRRDKLNDRFLELSSILDPGRPPRTDKASILSDAARLLLQLRSEAQELKTANEKLQETIKELRAEKNEHRDEKTRLKVDKERLEQQIKAMSVPPAGFIPHPVAIHPFPAAPPHPQNSQVQASKAAGPFSAFPAVPMWQWLPPAVVDTTQDAKLWSPNA